MTKTTKTGLQRLIDEKFGSEEPEWLRGKWDGRDMDIAQDKDNWYMRNGNEIIVQDKKEQGPPSCYICSGPIHYVEVPHSVHFKNLPLCGGGEVRNVRFPYCKNCQEKPAVLPHGIIEE